MAAALDRSLDGFSALIDRTLVDVRVLARMPVQTQRVSLAHRGGSSHCLAVREGKELRLYCSGGRPKFGD